VRYIIGYGNTLRGEDGFGVEVAQKLADKALKDTKVIELFQLTPELSLELLDASEIIFVDAAYCNTPRYALACTLQREVEPLLSHHISAHTIVRMLQELYKKRVHYEVFSILTSNYEKIEDEELYKKRVEEVAEFLL